MEASSHALDQGRVDGLSFEAAVWTCLGSDHLDYHHTIDEYARAKERIFSYLRPEGRAVINADDEHGRRLLQSLQAPSLVSFGLSADATVRLRLLDMGWQGMRLWLDSPWASGPIVTPLIGLHNASNVAAACAICLSFGIPFGAVQRALASFGGVPGRLERVPNAAGIHTLIDFAHTPDALRMVLQSVRELVRGRVIVVFGCGGDRDRTKRPVMGRIASELADYVVLTSDNPRSEDPAAILEEIRQGFPEHVESFTMMADREQAIAHALGLATAGDAVLVAGKGHEATQIFDQITVPFSDRDVVERYFQSSSARAIALS